MSIYQTLSSLFTWCRRYY